MKTEACDRSFLKKKKKKDSQGGLTILPGSSLFHSDMELMARVNIMGIFHFMKMKNNTRDTFVIISEPELFLFTFISFYCSDILSHIRLTPHIFQTQKQMIGQTEFPWIKDYQLLRQYSTTIYICTVQEWILDVKGFCWNSS